MVTCTTSFTTFLFSPVPEEVSWTGPNAATELSANPTPRSFTATVPWSTTPVHAIRDLTNAVVASPVLSTTYGV